MLDCLRKRMSRRTQPTEFDLLEIYVDEMERCGQSRNLISLSVDDDMALKIRSKLGVEIALEQLQGLADKCLAHEWLEHTVHGGKYSALALTTTGLGVVHSRQRKKAALANSSFLKRGADYVENHKGLFAGLTAAIALVTLLIKLLAG
jgi:hypothetical protein